MRLPGGNRASGDDPLLGVGIIAMALALVLALMAVVLTVLLRGAPERAVASVKETATRSSSEPLIRGKSAVRPWREKSIPAPEVPKEDAKPAPSRAEANTRFAPAAETEETSQPVPLPQPEPEARSEPKSGQRTATVGESRWSRPTPQEVEAANGPRHYDLPAGAIMSLTMGSIGIYGAPVFDSASELALARGVANLPDTSLPWSDTPQRNVYLAGHRMGYRGTWSRMIFYNLDYLQSGDRVVLRDRSGRTYEYRVSEIFLVDPADQ